MQIKDGPLKDLKIMEPDVHNDTRGYFFESYNSQHFPEELKFDWVQDNESKSTKGVLRGLHYQTGEMAQTKLVRSIIGEIYDVVVDIRPNSPTYGKHYGILLTGEDKKQMLIPRGFAHGFLVLSDEAIFSYKCDNYYDKESESGIFHNDPSLHIKWPIKGLNILLSEKDRNLPSFGDHEPIF